MDRFKFRVWNSKTKKYRDDIYLNHCGNTFIIPVEFGVILSPRFVNNIIIEQCLGITDVNKKLVFEGDVLEDKKGRRGYVYWDNEWSCYEIDFINNTFSISVYDWIWDKGYGTKVIGNIHENPELLEDK